MIEELRGQNVEVVYCPCCEPAKQTAQAIAQGLDIKLRKLDRMENLNHGLWQGMPIDEVRLKHPKVYRQWHEQPELVCPPEGEMLSQAAQRVEQAMTRLLKRHKEGVVGWSSPNRWPASSAASSTTASWETFGKPWASTAAGKS